MATDHVNSEIQLNDLNAGEPTGLEPESPETESMSSFTVDSSNADPAEVTVQQTDIATLDSDSASGLSAEWSESPYDARRVELEEGRRGFGFSLSGGVMSPLGHVPLFIASVDPHGPAAKTGMLQPGDRIVAINGEEYGREIPQRCGDCHQGCLWTDHVRCHARRREHSRFHCNGLKNFNMLF
ncbi:disks large homolog 1-like isoform X1 [Ptychodera flava]|uniref:disks large homolog 1-like isoform X1 n=1 Tax=Ptychodera flava TaxID=63121 RepID=UPI00396A6C85